MSATAEAIAVLALRSPDQRHAIARLLDLDDALDVLRWIAAQPDCDRATAAMIFWRAWLPAVDGHGAEAAAVRGACARSALIEDILARWSGAAWPMSDLGWDGREAWDGTELVVLPPPGTAERAYWDSLKIPPDLRGPFAGRTPATARRAFFDFDPVDDDIFDSLWRHHPQWVAVTDWLDGKPSDAWLAVVDALTGSHPDDIYGWMIEQPACTRAVAARIFWWCEPGWYAKRQFDGEQAFAGDVDRLIDRILARWRADGFADDGIGFDGNGAYRALLALYPGRDDPFAIPADLLDGHAGRAPEPVSPATDIDFWYFVCDLGGGVPRGAGEAEWQAWRAEHAKQEARRLAAERYVREIAARPATMLERLFYGGKYTGAKAQIDRCWKQYNLVMILLALGLLVIIRMRLPLPLGFTYFLVAVAILAVYQTEGRMGGARRLVPWYAASIALVMATAMLLRWMDFGKI